MRTALEIIGIVVIGVLTYKLIMAQENYSQCRTREADRASGRM
jgi:hypothetical protein